MLAEALQQALSEAIDMSKFPSGISRKAKKLLRQISPNTIMKGEEGEIVIGRAIGDDARLQMWVNDNLPGESVGRMSSAGYISQDDFNMGPWMLFYGKKRRLGEGYDQQAHRALLKHGPMKLDQLAQFLGANDVYAKGDVLIALKRLVKRGKVVEKGDHYVAPGSRVTEGHDEKFCPKCKGKLWPKGDCEGCDYKADLDAMEPPEDEVKIPDDLKPEEPPEDEEGDEEESDEEEPEEDEEEDEEPPTKKTKKVPPKKEESLSGKLAQLL